MKERVLNKSFKKVYNKKQTKDWIKFGLDNEYIKKDDTFIPHDVVVFLFGR